MSCMIWECIMQHCDECRRPVVMCGSPCVCIFYFRGIVSMCRGKDVVYNVLGYLVFAVLSEMPFIAYREPPSGGVPCTPPDPPSTPPAVRTYQACELLAKTHGVGFVDSTCWWGRCGGNATMGYIKNNASRLGYTLRTKFHKRMKIWQKSQCK